MSSPVPPGVVAPNGTGSPPNEAFDLYKPIGKTGLVQFNGYVFQTLQRELQGAQGRTILRQMAEQDSTIAGILLAMEMLLRRVTYEAAPPSSRPDDQANAAFVNEAIDDMSTTFADTMSDILTMLTFGWSLFELIYKRRQGATNPDPTKRSKFSDGRIGWRKWSIRAQESLLHWEIDDEGGIQGMWQVAPPDYRLRFIPIEKALLFRTSTRLNSPEGYSPLISVYRDWWFKTRLQNFEAIGIERDLAGLPEVLLPSEILDPNAPAAMRQTYTAYKNLIANVRNDEQGGIIMPSDRDANGNLEYEFKLVTTGGTRQIDVGAAIGRYDTNMAIRLLADFVKLGHEAVGSFALSESKTNLFTVMLSAWPEMIASVINQHAIPRLFALNGLPTDELPQVEPGRLSRSDMQEVALALQQLSQAGMTIFPNPVLEAFILEQLDLPVVELPQVAPLNLGPANPPAVEETPGASSAAEEASAALEAASGETEG